MPHAGLGRNTTASSLALTPDIVHQLCSTSSSLLLHTCIQTVCTWPASQESRQLTHTPTLGKGFRGIQVK